MKDKIINYCIDTYHTKEEHPWQKFPENIVLRHGDNGKWYGLIMPVDGEKLSLLDTDFVWVLNVKCDPMLASFLVGSPGYYPAYHMNKANWISILLDGTVKEEQVLNLLDESYELTMSAKEKRTSRRNGPKDWLIPANPKYYDVVKAFSDQKIVDWKQGNDGMLPGDYVYFYVASPHSAILFYTKILETNLAIPEYLSKSRMKKRMRVELLHTFKEEDLPLSKMAELGVKTVRGPRGIPSALKDEILRILKEDC